jgi:hypothetical protein
MGACGRVFHLLGLQLKWSASAVRLWGIPVRLVTALVAVLASLAVAGCVMPPDGPPYPHLPVVAGKSSRAFGDSAGVNVRLTYLDTGYGDFDTLRARLKELGVRYVSDSLCPTCEYQIDRLQRLAAAGIKANIGIGWWSGGTATIAPGLKAVKERLRSSAVSVSGVNEPDLKGDPDWVAKTRAYQRQLYFQVQADPVLASLNVIGPSLVYRASRAQLGDLSDVVDHGNIHPYPGGLPPLGNLADEQQMMSAVSGNKPLEITEVGYHTNLADTTPHRPASERAVAIYTPRTLLEAFRFGIKRTYFYQLADLWSPQEAQRRNYSASYNSFGLLRWDLSRKPAFLALRNLLRVVDGDSTPVASPDGLRLALEGAGSDVRRLLLRSADGSYALVLWRDVSVWDRNAQRDLFPTPDRVNVVLGEPITVARRFEPVTSDTELQRWTYPRRIPVDLAGAPVVLRLTPWSVAAMANQ